MSADRYSPPFNPTNTVGGFNDSMHRWANAHQPAPHPVALPDLDDDGLPNLNFDFNLDAGAELERLVGAISDPSLSGALSTEDFPSSSLIGTPTAVSQAQSPPSPPPLPPLPPDAAASKSTSEWRHEWWKDPKDAFASDTRTELGNKLHGSTNCKLSDNTRLPTTAFDNTIEKVLFEAAFKAVLDELSRFESNKDTDDAKKKRTVGGRGMYLEFFKPEKAAQIKDFDEQCRPEESLLLGKFHDHPKIKEYYQERDAIAAENRGKKYKDRQKPGLLLDDQELLEQRLPEMMFGVMDAAHSSIMARKSVLTTAGANKTHDDARAAYTAFNDWVRGANTPEQARRRQAIWQYMWMLALKLCFRKIAFTIRNKMNNPQSAKNRKLAQSAKKLKEDLAKAKQANAALKDENSAQNDELYQARMRVQRAEHQATLKDLSDKRGKIIRRLNNHPKSNRHTGA